MSLYRLINRLQFQHTAARRRLPVLCHLQCITMTFQHTAARRRLPKSLDQNAKKAFVSTHSRAEAAACKAFFFFIPRLFQHTAARRRLPILATN